MQAVLDLFEGNLQRVEAVHALYASFAGKVTSALDLSDMLRAEIVLCVSALDHFIHEITCQGMMATWRGERDATPAYLKFPITMNVSAQLSSGSKATFLEAEIRSRHSHLTFQQPDKIADAIRLFSNAELWNEVSGKLGEDQKNIRGRLKLLVERRNKIAHEADVDPSYPGQRWPIGPADVEDAIRFVRQLGNAIYEVVK